MVIPISVVLSATGFAQELTVGEKISLEGLNKAYAADKKTASFQYAWLLYRTNDGASYAKADSVMNQVIALQDDDPESNTYGQWNWRWRNGEKFADWNNALFKADILFAKLWDHQSKMSAQTRANFITSCKRVVEAAQRRWDTEVFDIYRDYVKYSNIFVLYIETFTLAGDRFNDVRLQKKARGQWIRWYNHISFFGIDEFASPSYNHLIFAHLPNIHDFCHDERTRREVIEVMDHIYLLQSALTHPVLKLPVSGISRDYRNFLLQADARSGVLTSPVPDGYVAPSEAIEINEHRTYPFEVIGKASINPFIFKSYQLKDAAMGSMTGGACFQQQIHCLVAVGENEHERAVAFLQGSFTPVNGYTDQKGTTTLCVYNRLPAYWHLTQKRLDMSVYRDTFGEFGVGISSKWTETLNAPDHIVLEAFGYDLHIFPFAVQIQKVVKCELVKKHRTTTSPRYHPRPRLFDEYVFPQEPDWFGAYLALVKSGSEVADPGIAYSKKNGISSFNTNMGHRVRLFIAEKGDTRQLFNVDPELIPRLKIIE